MLERLIPRSVRQWRTALPALLLVAGSAALAGGWYFIPTGSSPTDADSALATLPTSHTATQKSTAPVSATQAREPAAQPVRERPGTSASETMQRVATAAPEPQADSAVATTDSRTRQSDDADDGDMGNSAAAPRRQGAVQATATNVHYYNIGYNPAGRERIQSALQANDGEVIHISNAGDEIRVSRNNTTDRPPTDTSPESASRDGGDNSSQPDMGITREPEVPEMATGNCPGSLPENTSEAVIRSMTQNFGCRYLLTCHLSNDGTGQVLCAFTFAGVNG